MSEPETYNEVMEWFGTGHKAGHYDLHGLSLILTHATEPPVRVWDYVLSNNLLQRRSKECWITPRGKVWNVAFAMHEHLLSYPMEGLDVKQIELAGWLRVSKNNALIRTKPTRIQLDTLAVLRPDLQARAPFNKIERRQRYPEAEKFDVAPLKLEWTVWVPEIDAR